MQIYSICGKSVKFALYKITTVMKEMKMSFMPFGMSIN